MLSNRIFIISVILLMVFVGNFWFFAPEAQAIGISPPLVKNDHLLKGSHFEQIVYINQGAPKENLRAKAEINVSEKIKDWVRIEPGLEFLIPMVRLFPVKVIVDVPENAELGHYGGEIKITTFPEVQDQSQVSVGIGLAIALDFTVTEELMVDYDVPLWRIVPMEDGWPLKVAFTIENRGNAKTRPQKIVARLAGSGLPSSGPFEVNGLDYVGPFQRGEIIAEFPVNLAEGAYLLQIQFYKTPSEVLEFNSGFDVLPEGSLPKPPKPWWFWVAIGFMIALVAALTLAVIKFRDKIVQFFIGIKVKFQTIKNKLKKIIKVLGEKETDLGKKGERKN